MPYKDPERKRQWEREHREERNARRRKALSRTVLEGLDSPKPDSMIGRESSTGTNIMAMFIMVAFTVVVIPGIKEIALPRRFRRDDADRRLTVTRCVISR